MFSDRQKLARVIPVDKKREADALARLHRIWSDPGKHPLFHERRKDMVRTAFPLLAEALDEITRPRKSNS